MHAIDEQTVDRTWQEIAGYDPETALEKMAMLGEEQAPLMSMVMAETEDLDQDARELAIYMFFVIYFMFRDVYGRPIDEISIDEILSERDRTEQLMDDVARLGDEDGQETIAPEIIAEENRQPWVMRYVVETLLEEEQGAESIELSDDARAIIFLAMRSVVMLLDQATGQQA